MNKKSAIYGLVTLLAGSTITALSVTDIARAHARNQVQAPSGTTTPAPQGMGMRVEVDRPFIEMMVPHHKGSVEMSNFALRRAQSSEVKKLAAHIKQEQSRENQQMESWYRQWYGTEVPTSSSSTRGMSQSMNQDRMDMSMEAMQDTMAVTMETLKNASNFDREFLKEMISHHQMAVMAAQLVVNSAEHPEIRNLAQTIVKDQSAEIDRMRQLYQE